MENKKIGTLSQRDISAIYEDYERHQHDGDVIEKYGTILVLDVLGWKNKASPQTIKIFMDLVNSLRSKIDSTVLKNCDALSDSNIDVVVFSDTVAICINHSSPYNELNIFNELSNFLVEALKKDIAFRGAISRGKYYTNSLNNVFVGNAFYEAAEYCEKTEWSGVIITDSLAKELLVNNTVEQLREFNLVSYEDIPYKEAPCFGNLVLVPVTLFKDIPYEKMANLYKVALKDVPGKLANTLKFLEYTKSFYS